MSAVALLSAACTSGGNDTIASTGTGHEKMELKVTSSAFDPGERIPTKYSGEGEDVSPPLAWSEPPAGTVEFALICDDPDAPTPKPWVHWVAYGIAGDTRALAEAVSSGIVEGRNSWDRSGYGGPMPPKGHGLHHYHFRLYALDTRLGDRAGLDKDQLLSAMKGHVLAEGELVGTYERK